MASQESPPEEALDILIQDELNHPSLLAANAGKHPYPVISLVHHLRSAEPGTKVLNALHRLIEKQYLQAVDGFIFNSMATRRAVQSLVGNIQPYVVAYPPADRFGPPVSESAIRLRASGTGPIRLLFLGSVVRRKGLHTLLQALSTLTNRQWLLDVVGSSDSEPSYARRVQRQASALSPPSSVVFHGALDDDPLRQILMQAHALVVPSAYEGYGISYLEGMCFGLPAIGTTGGAAGEIITDGLDGFLIEPDNPSQLAEKLSILYDGRDVLLRMSFAARERYLRQPPWRQSVGNIRGFLRSIIGRNWCYNS